MVLLRQSVSASLLGVWWTIMLIRTHRSWLYCGARTSKNEAEVYIQKVTDSLLLLGTLSGYPLHIEGIPFRFVIIISHSLDVLAA